MPERSVGRGYDAENGAEYRVEAWTGKGGLEDWRELEKGHRLTRSALSNASHIVVSYTYPDGSTEYRTFTGPIEDLERTIDYWKSIDSL